MLIAPPTLQHRTRITFAVLGFFVLVSGLILLLQDDFLHRYSSYEEKFVHKSVRDFSGQIAEEGLAEFMRNEEDLYADPFITEEEQGFEDIDMDQKIRADESDIGDDEAREDDNVSAREGEERFFVVLRYMEQLTKAQMALEEIAWLSKSLGRTLVLPQVGSSTMGLSKLNTLPFSTYFDVEQLQKFVPVITYEEFTKVTYGKISRSILFKQTKLKDYTCRNPGTPHSIELYGKIFRFSNSSCIDNMPLKDASTYLKTFARDQTLGIAGYRAEDLWMDEEHEDSLPRLKFSPLIIAEVDRYINNDVRQRFLAVHWRTETIDYVDKCARAVVDYVSEIAATKKLTKIYLATDLGPTQKSITIHDQDRFLNTFEYIQQSLKPIHYEPNERVFQTNGDTGVLGIIEKLICAKSSYFLGLQGRCSKHSSYTRHIGALKDEMDDHEYLLEWDVELSKIGVKPNRRS